MIEETESWRRIGTPVHGGIVLVSDHASNRVPEGIELGITQAQLDDHIGWDIGVGAVADRMARRHGIETLIAETPDSALRAYRAADRRLFINAALPTESRKFMLGHQLMMLEGQAVIADVVRNAALPVPGADRLLAIGLGNYAAGALLMPYAAFREAARTMRHDIDRLARTFGVSFEQACHRLSTLQRPGLRGIPFFFCRVDMAGNITKRHSATRLQFARFGGACPLWNVHEAVAVPDRINVQLGETPDGVRYVSMAKGLVKPSGSYMWSAISLNQPNSR